MSTPTRRTVGFCLVWSAVACALGLTTTVPAAAQSGSDIHLIPIHENADGSHALGPRSEQLNATDRPGYDNQPAFLADSGGFLFTSIHEDAQADIYVYDIATGETRRITTTPEAEYSPTPLAGGERFSSVRVEIDTTQRLWSFNMSGEEPELLLEEIKGIGYHAWNDEEALVLFVLGEPHELHLVRPGATASQQISLDIGRSMHVMPDGMNFSFVQHPDTLASMHSLDPRTGETHELLRLVEGGEDVSWAPWGELWMTAGSSVYARSAGPGADPSDDWRLIEDLANRGLSGLTRLTFSPDGNWLAIVAEEPTPPEESPGE